MFSQEQLHRKPVSHPPQSYSHSRTRTTSSNVFPNSPNQHQGPMPTHLQQPQPTGGHTRRSPSVNTFSTASSIPPPPAAFRTSPTTDLRRSTSSRSFGNQQVSYVALLRKQKATVWCDRAQFEDPTMLAQQRAAKQRANQQVVGRQQQHYRTSTGMSSTTKGLTKFRHGGKPGVVGYTPENNYIGVAGVPMRLSATEVEGEDSEEEDVSKKQLHHRRTGSSGHSSMTSSRRGPTYARTSGSIGHSRTPERGSIAEGDDRIERTRSTHSGSSAERGDVVTELETSRNPNLASTSWHNATLTREKSVKNPEELKRRGSVDENTVMKSFLPHRRLQVINPDVDD
ncbi:hypothetical protein F5Y16DRAFT_39193 [Xylariaceae sp. FL0255]|nr:hypothetical protein F5Y16DRAFT_39193 [Xylariaceae sp. FL0255]